MAGFYDTRGLAYEISAGLSAQLLSRSFKTSRLISLTCQYDHLYRGRGKDILDNFNILGKIIGQSEDLMKNVVFILNKVSDSKLTANKIAMKIASIAQENKDLDPDTLFVMKQLTSAHIMVVDIPDQNFFNEFFKRVNATTSKPFSTLNFRHFHREAEKFKRLLTRLREYHAEQEKEMKSIQTSLAQTQRSLLQDQVDRLETTPRAEMEPMLLPQSLKSTRDNLQQQYDGHTILSEQILQGVNDLQRYIDTYYHTDDTITLMTGKNPIDAMRIRLASISVANDFFESIKLVETALESGQQEISVNAAGDQTSSASFGSSWPLPGAAAYAVGYGAKPPSLASGSTQAETPIYLYLLLKLYTSLRGALPNLETLQALLISAYSSTAEAAAETTMNTREYAGVKQPPCRFNWEGVYQYLLPSTTLTSNGAQEIYGASPLATCAPKDHRVEFKMLMDSYLQVDRSIPGKQEIVVQIGARDTRILTGYTVTTAKSFLTSAATSFTQSTFNYTGYHPKHTEIATELMHCLLLSILFSPESALLHMGLICLTKLGVVSSNTARHLSIAISAALILGEINNGYFNMAIQILTSMLGTKMGERAGKSAATLFFKSSPPQKPTASIDYRPEC